MPGYLAGVWGDFWEFEIESIDAIGGLLLDEAEYLADAEELPGWFRDICEGIIGSDDELSLGGVVGATLGGFGKCASDLGKSGAQLLGHPVETAQDCYDSAKYVCQHWSEIPSQISNWWNNTTSYEKITAVVEAYAMCRVFASGGAEGETVTLESEVAGVTGEAGEAAGIAAEAGEAGGIVGSEGVAAVERAAGAIEGAAGEAAEAIEGAAGKGKIRIESAGESGSYSSLRDLMSPEEAARYDGYWNNVADDMLKSNLGDYRRAVLSGDITKTTGGKINSKVVTAAIDTNTGDIYYGISGMNNNPTRNMTNPQMQEILNSVNESMTNYPLENCGEFNAINNALNNGANIQNLRVYSIDRVSGNYKAPCINCQNLYGNIVHFTE